MRLEIASPENSAELCQFFERFSLNSILELKIRRPQDFFAFYQLQSNQSQTFVLRDDKDASIQALASFVFRETFLENRLQRIALATDLRVLPTRKAVLTWSKHFLPVLREVIRNEGVSSVFSAINSYDTAAFNAFVRPGQMKRALPRYYLYRKFRLVSLHGRFPWASPPPSGLRLRRGSENLRQQLIDYYKSRAPHHAFSSVWDEKSFNEKLTRLRGLRIDDFWVAFDSSEKIVGALAPWSQLPIQEYCPLNYGLRANNFRQFLKFGRLLRWTRPIVKPEARTGEDKPLQFRFLTFLAADHEDILESLLWQAYESISSDEFLVYGHCLQDFKYNPPLDWITAEMPFGLYSVLPPEMPLPAFAHPSHELNPEIEACYLF